MLFSSLFWLLFSLYPQLPFLCIFHNSNTLGAVSWAIHNQNKLQYFLVFADIEHVCDSLFLANDVALVPTYLVS